MLENNNDKKPTTVVIKVKKVGNPTSFNIRVEGVKLEQYTKWGKPGIRAQLLDIRKRRLEMDFVLEGDDRSMHVLNAVSPAFTCSLPFSQYVCDRIEQAVH